MPYFMKKACESESPLEKMKYVMTAIVSSTYYMNLFLKPVINLWCSSTQSLAKPSKELTQMGLRFTVSKFHIILQSVISYWLVLRTAIGMSATTLSKPTPGSIPWPLPTRAGDGLSSLTVQKLMWILTKKSMPGSSWAACDQRLSAALNSKMKQTN